jgi:hypothetical protein
VRKLGDIRYGIYLIQAVVLWLVTLKLGLSTDGRLRPLAARTAIVVSMTVLYGYLVATGGSRLTRGTHRNRSLIEVTLPYIPPTLDRRVGT